MSSRARAVTLRTAVLLWVCWLLACTSGVKAETPQRPTPEQGPSFMVPMQATKLFSHAGYNYGPSVIAQGSTRQIWWCGKGRPPGATFNTDVIYYRTLNTNTGIMSPVRMVFWPEVGRWDGRYTCDPSVIRGDFNYNGAAYTYALYYTATDLIDGTNNRIGLAFSNNGVTWTRCAQNPIIFPAERDTRSYGAGQAATYRDAVGELVLLHTDTSAGGVFARTSADGINFGAPARLSDDGASPFGNNDFAYDSSGGQIYAAIELPGRPGDREVSTISLYRIPADRLATGHWERLATVDTSLTGSYLNHSPGFVRDASGMLDATRLELYFSEGNNDPETWTLYTIGLTH